MDDKQSKTPWDLLAQELGAKPSSEAFERSQPPAVEIPAVEAPSEQDEASEVPQQAPSNWNALADTLGLEVPESPESEIESTELEEAEPEEIVPEPVEEVAANLVEEPSTSPEPHSEDTEPLSEDTEPPIEDTGFGSGIHNEDSADSLPPLPNEVDQIMSEGDWENEEAADSDQTDADLEKENVLGMSGNAAKNAFDALFSADGSALAIPSPRQRREELPLDAEASTDSADVVEKANGSDDDDKEVRPKRKRSRRRGRGRGRGGRNTETEQAPSEETAGDRDALNGEDRKEFPQEESSNEESSDDGEKPRRRRPRRRSRRSASADNPTKTSDSGDANDSNDADESMDSLTYGDNELAEDRGTSHRDSIGHRNMPTWAEALSDIIEGNLELHSKAPSRQSSSRGRGRGRGGRGRKKS